MTGDTQGSKVGERLQDILGGSVCGRTSGEKATAHVREMSSREEEHQRQELRGQNVPQNLKEQQGGQCVDCLTLLWGAGTSHVINTVINTLLIQWRSASAHEYLDPQAEKGRNEEGNLSEQSQIRGPTRL